MNRIFSTRLKDWQDALNATAKKFGPVDVEALNVLTLIGRLDKIIPGIRRHYDVLSEMCHPNGLGHDLMYGLLNHKTATLHLSDSKPFDRGHFAHVVAAFGLIELAELSLIKINALLPRVTALSEKSRRGGAKGVRR